MNQVGYSGKLLTEVDANDARAATKVWLKHFMENIGRMEGSETVVLDGVESAVRGVRERRLDLLVLLPTEYLLLRQQIDMVPMLVSMIQGQPGFHLGLLCRIDAATALADLQDGDLLLADGGVGDLPRIWLDSVLCAAGQPTADIYFRQPRTVDRAARAVLPVFFGQAAACIVNLGAYDTMVELNPQLGREMRIVHKSPLLPMTVICARPDAYEDFGRALEQGMGTLHEDPEGQQILNIFGVDRLVPFREEYLDPVRALVHTERATEEAHP